MERLPKERKGVVWGMMTEDERECFALFPGTLMEYFPNHGWVESRSNDPVDHAAYWMKEWDEPTEKELVGKCCVLWNADSEEFVVGKVLDYDDDMDFYCAGGWYDHARPATEEDFDKLMR